MKSSDDPLQKLLHRILFHLGRSIRRRRMELRLTQDEFCLISKVSVSELKFVEAGDRNVTLGIVLRICITLDGTSLTEVISETERRLMEDEEGLVLWRSLMRQLRDLMETVPKARRRRLSE